MGLGNYHNISQYIFGGLGHKMSDYKIIMTFHNHVYGLGNKMWDYGSIITFHNSCLWVGSLDLGQWNYNNNFKIHPSCIIIV